MIKISDDDDENEDYIQGLEDGEAEKEDPTGILDNIIMGSHFDSSMGSNEDYKRGFKEAYYD